MAKKIVKAADVVETQDPVETSVQTEASGLLKEATVGTAALAAALVQAINLTKPVEKKTFATRKPKTPWTSKDGSPKAKLKRAAHQHGMEIDEDKLSNEEIVLFNKLRPGRFLNGLVTVTRRRDRGIDVSYPVKTAAQRLKLVNLFGIRNLAELLTMCANEAANPPKQIEDVD